MHRLFAFLLVVYAFLISVADAFRLHRWVPVPMAVLLLAAAVVTAALAWQPRVPLTLGFFRQADLLLVVYVLTLGVTLFISLRIEQKHINHFVAYTSVIGLYYFFVKFLCAAHDTFRRHQHWLRGALALSVFVTAVYTVLEFLDMNVLRLGITSLVKFPGEEQPYEALFALFTRARGFVAESGFLALFFNIFVPMSFVYLRRAWGAKTAAAYLLLCFVAFVTTFSVAGLTFMGLGLVVALGMYLYDRYVILLPLRSAVVLFSVVAAVMAIGLWIPTEFWEPVGAKLTLGDVSSGSFRLEGWVAAAAVAAEHPVFGTGIGSTSLETGSGVLSFYLTMLKEAGVLALVSIVLFFASVFRQIAALPSWNRYKYAYAASFTAAICHLAVISDIWYPWLWLLCVLVAAEYAGRFEAAA